MNQSKPHTHTVYDECLRFFAYWVCINVHIGLGKPYFAHPATLSWHGHKRLGANFTHTRFSPFTNAGTVSHSFLPVWSSLPYSILLPVTNC